MGGESTEDRLSGAARMLELTQQCEELKARLEDIGAAQVRLRCSTGLTIDSADPL